MSSDRLTRALTAFVRQVLSPTDYHALYPARVVAQSGQLLDLQPDDERLPGVTGVPMRLGLPGVEVDVEPGSRVLLGFEGGDPSRPVATLWEADGVAEIRFGKGTKSVARVGDAVGIGGVAVPPTGMAGWIAQVTTALNTLAPGSVTVAPTEVGSITKGADRVKA